MGSLNRAVYRPIPTNAAAYNELYAEYLTLHDYFGRGANEVMHRLKTRRRAATAAHGTEQDAVLQGDDEHERAWG
jgi:L-ribulokinase